MLTDEDDVVVFDVQFDSPEGGILCVEYAQRWQLKWRFLGCESGCETVIHDLIPGGLPDDDANPYETYPLGSFPSLTVAEAGSPARVVALDVRRAFHHRQLQLAKATTLGVSVARDVEYATSRLRGVVATRRGLVLVVDVFAESDAAEGDLFSVVLKARSSVPQLVVTYSEEHRHVEFTLPHKELPHIAAAFRQPVWEEAESLEGYLGRARRLLFEPWCKRRSLVLELRRRHVVVDVDDAEYSRLTLVFELLHERQIWLCMLSFAIPFDFPATPPTMTISNYAGGGVPQVLDRGFYRYSPRWDVARIRSELFAHACRELPRFFFLNAHDNNKKQAPLLPPTPPPPFTSV